MLLQAVLCFVFFYSTARCVHFALVILVLGHSQLCGSTYVLSNVLIFIVIVREHKVVLEDLDKAQVDILHVGSNRKNAADDKLKQLMRRLLMGKQETRIEIEIWIF